MEKIVEQKLMHTWCPIQAGQSDVRLECRVIHQLQTYSIKVKTSQYKEFVEDYCWEKGSLQGYKTFYCLIYFKITYIA